jgi:hypothetical protein
MVGLRACGGSGMCLVEGSYMTSMSCEVIGQQIENLTQLSSSRSYTNP